MSYRLGALGGIPVSFRTILRHFSSKLKKQLASLLHRPGEPPSPEFAPRWGGPRCSHPVQLEDCPRPPFPDLRKY